MQILKKINSFFNSISYCIGCILVDVGDYWDGFKQAEYVLLTHAHFDHIYGLNKLVDSNPKIKVFTNLSGKQMLCDAKKNLSYYHESSFVFDYPPNIVVINDGEEVVLKNGLIAKAVFTPGHNPSCITWIIDDYVFSGDSYIPGVKVITNLPDGNKEFARQSIEKIRQLSFSKKLLPGHFI